MRKITILFVFFVVTAGAVLTAEAPGRTERAADADWQQAIGASIRASEYDISRQSESVIPGHPGGLHAANRAQDLRAYFLPEGVDLVRRTEETPSWRLRLALTGFGASDPREKGRTVTYRRGPLIETYENREDGIHVSLRRAHANGGSAIRATYRIDTDLEAIPAFDGSAVAFYQEGQPVVQVSVARPRVRAARAVSARAGPGSARSETNDVRRAILSWSSGRLTVNGGEAIGGGETPAIELLLTGGGARTPDALPSTIPDWFEDGDRRSTNLGYSVATAGDVNGDGFSDLIVGAPQNGGIAPGPYNGRAFVFYGTADGLPAAPDWWAEIGSDWDSFGTSVASAGDANGDGFDDVLIGSPEYVCATNCGHAYLYLGSASGLGDTPAWTGTAAAGLRGSYYGASVATAGDVNRDGYDDILIGQEDCNGPVYGFNSGCVFVHYGSANGISNPPTKVLELAQIGILGTTVATAGDVNGDLADDLVIGGSYGGSTDEAYIFYGSTSGLSTTPDLTLNATNKSGFGASVSTAGDVNCDGYSDVLVGNPRYAGTGKVFLYLGGASGIDPDAAWTALGSASAEDFGVSVGTAGDVNGDGCSDILAGAKRYDGGVPSQGQVSLYYGRPFNVPSPVPWQASSNAAGAEFGSSVATAGDVNGDGYGDVIVGAPRYDVTPSIDAGRVFLYYGAPPPGSLDPQLDGTDTGTIPNGFLGWAMDDAGDVNGDGFSDLIVGAPDFTNNTNGAAYVYLGSADGFSGGPDWGQAGDPAGFRFGSQVSAAGDVDGDGYGDGWSFSWTAPG